jgi:signal peptidase
MSPPDDADGERSDTDPPDERVLPDESASSGDTPPPDESGLPDDGNGRSPETGEDSQTGTADREEMDWRTFAYDIVNSAVAVLLVGALLFAVSGVWPPMVAIESPSMTPQMQTGDLVFVMEETRFSGEGAHEETGVVTARVGETTDADYRKFQRQGDVIVYEPRGNGETTPIIHRAMFWVEEGENWYEKADKQAIGRYDACGETPGEALPNCPAPHDGFVTKGDANARYDQVDELSGPVKPEWIVGTAEVRVPLLGCIRLRTERCLANAGVSGPGATGFGTDGLGPTASGLTVAANGTDA